MEAELSLEQASDIAQVVAGVAVVISLIYVGLQMRQATAQLYRNEGNATLSQFSAHRLAIGINRDVAELWIKGLAGDGALDGPDQLRFDMLLAEFTWITFHTWEREKRGMTVKGQWERGPLVGITRYLSTPGGSAWWARYGKRYPPPYAAEVDSGLASLSARQEEAVA